MTTISIIRKSIASLEHKIHKITDQKYNKILNQCQEKLEQSIIGIMQNNKVSYESAEKILKLTLALDKKINDDIIDKYNQYVQCFHAIATNKPIIDNGKPRYNPFDYSTYKYYNGCTVWDNSVVYYEEDYDENYDNYDYKHRPRQRQRQRQPKRSTIDPYIKFGGVRPQVKK